MAGFEKAWTFFMQTSTVQVGVTCAGAVNASKDWLGEKGEQETKGNRPTEKKKRKLLSTVLFSR
jgi:hypothetical protein